MKATREVLRSRHTPVLLAAMVGLALAGSGCIIDGGSSAPVCTPDLTVSWRILSASTGGALTCAAAGNADTLNAQIDGGGLSGLTDFPAPCDPNASSGSFVALLPTDGYYGVSLQLKAGSTVLSETTVLDQWVDCSGLSATPRADLSVNF